MHAKTFEALKDIRGKFEEPVEEKEVRHRTSNTVRDLANSMKYADHATLRKRDLMIQEILGVVLIHINQLNSPKTALQLLGKASGLSQNRQSADNQIQKNIIKAGQALKNYLKVTRKKKTRFGKYDPTAARSHWMNAFNENLQEAILAVQTDIQKREGTFFEKLIQNSRSDLPIKLPDTKKVTYVESPMVVNLKTSPTNVDKRTKFRIVEGKLILLAKANLIGLNTTKNKATKGLVATANKYAEKKFGATVYPSAIPRPSKNIMWFLVLDFGVNIDSATFAEDMALTKSVGGIVDPQEAATLADYVNQFNAIKERQRIVNLENQKAARKAFEAEFDYVFEDLKIEKRKLEGLVEVQGILAKEFSSLTSLTGEVADGLQVKQYNTKAFDAFFETFMRQQMSHAEKRNHARLSVLDQRVEARYIYFCHAEVAIAATRSRAIIKGIQARLDEAKRLKREVA